MRVDLIHPSDLGVAEVASWHGMQRASPSLANPFLAPEFAIAAGRYRPGARVGVLSDNSGTLGYFPFETRRFGLGVPISGWLSACQGVIHMPNAQWTVRELLRGCGLAAWQFDNLLVEQAPFEAHHSAIVPSPVINLTDNDYHAKLHVRAPRMSRELDRKSRKLGREFGALRLVCDSPDQAMLRLLMTWKSEQYRRTQNVDRFARPWVVQLFEELFATRTDALSGELSVLYAGEHPVSIQLGLRTRGVLVGWFTGYNIQFRKYSPGIIHVMTMAEELPSRGVEVLHMGKGAARFTKALKNGDHFVAEGTATARTITGAIYRLQSTSRSWAVRKVRQHAALHGTADLLLRGSGVSGRIYGRI
jgi:CelD/BcsL family acetyltransferase involved in cellulose biosynthesis